MTPIEEIKQKLNVVDVVGQYVSLKKSGKNYKGVCPFHSENTPSFMVSEELGIYKCFGCGHGGDMFNFIEEIEGVEFPQAVKILADKAGVELEEFNENPQHKKKKLIYEINHLTSEFYHYLLVKNKVGLPGLSYLKDKRKLSLETIGSFKLGYAPNSWDLLYTFLKRKKYEDADLLLSGVVVPKKSGGYIDKFRDRVVFPLFSIDGKVLGFTGRVLSKGEPKYLNTSETPVFQKSTYVYALDKAKTHIKKQGAIFVEGQMDVITAHQFGFSNVVASSGTSLTSGQLSELYRYTKDLTFCFDSDTAGSAATLRAIELAEKVGFSVKVAVLPDSYKDLDEIINADKASAEKMFANSMPAYDYYLVNSLKKHNKKDPIGKKKIMEELVPVYSRISNKVLLDHYTKKIAEQLEIDVSVVDSLISKKAVFTSDSKEQPRNTPDNTMYVDSNYFSKSSAESYILALLFKTPIDNIETFMYFGDHNSLNEHDFTDNKLQEIYKRFKEYLIGNNGVFKIELFSTVLDPELHKLAEELYMWDLGEIEGNVIQIQKELETAYLRIKEATKKRKMTEITEKIKMAELEKNTKLVEELSKEFERLM